MAAVSKISKAGNVTIFSEGEDWIMDKRDPIVQEILTPVKKVQKKTKIYEHRGTYRMRAWIIPEGKEGDSKVRQANPFGRQGA